MEALVGQQGDFWIKSCTGQDFEDGCGDVVILLHPQDPGNTVLDVLQPLDVVAGDPAVVNPRGDNGMDTFLALLSPLRLPLIRAIQIQLH